MLKYFGIFAEPDGLVSRAILISDTWRHITVDHRSMVLYHAHTGTRHTLWQYPTLEHVHRRRGTRAVREAIQE
eukprot:1335932-Amorphochlora_amoeboformis.AAC.2